MMTGNFFTETLQCGCQQCQALNVDSDGDAANTAPTTLYGSGLHKISDLNLNALLAYRNSSNLTFSGFQRWNADETVRLNPGQTLDFLTLTESGVGTGVTLGYYFTQTMPSNWGETGFAPIPLAFQNIIKEEFAKISNIANISFTEVKSDTGGKVLTMGLADTASQEAAGFGYYPSYSYRTSNGVVTEVTYQSIGGDNIYDAGTVNRALANTNGNLYLGHLARHEIGHALGLTHPFDEYYKLPESAQNYMYTAMAYTDANDLYDIKIEASGGVSQIPARMLSLGILDILALQKLYGANTSYRNGNDTYTWDQKVAFREVIYDAGGNDTIDLSTHTMRSYIDLTGDNLSSIGLRVTKDEILVNVPKTSYYSFVDETWSTYRAKGNLGIIGTIENVYTGSNNDRINGNSANNTINAGDGDDVVWGGAGNDVINLGLGNDRVVAGSGNNTVNAGAGWDIAGISANRSDLTISFGATTTTVTTKMGELSTYTGVEMFVLSNGEIVLNGRKIEGFDETFYLNNNPDIANAVQNGVLTSGWDHYKIYGKIEGRLAVNAIGNPLYDEEFYLASNPDIAAAVKVGALRTGYDHYASYGKNEGRIASPFNFDANFYLTKNADVAAAVKAGTITAYDHFMNNGWKEGRDPSAYFDTSSYLSRYTDVAAAGMNPYTHFLNFGLSEGRTAFIADIGWEWNFG